MHGDLGQIVDLAIRKDGLGFQVFNAVNDTITATIAHSGISGEVLCRCAGPGRAR